ncbi:MULTISPECIES: HAMP domain-containing sensor histidine kinase [unclassified Microbacterium]|uniref:sensor histidine kinase n=1 Tax=unclassified Microbacterium TaxID=2609290 RepID=UPI00214AA8E3|nr:MULTISPECIES: HAMP domain-containing sensor histidine kinase [unclassified Microbacterium]MCR2809345.1 HAMP domain-containing histidine kinase [Microbacterium sp. zg.B185]WIM20485.1 HAMP domain-containing sensor histidine kinase [Microbacterium sp. zg-B185]
MTGSGRPRGLSVRVKLTLSYAGFLVIAGIALFIVGFLLLRFVPDGNLSMNGGGFVPSRQDLVEVFVRYAWWAMGLLVLFGLVGGWLLAGIVLRPLGRITAVAGRARDGELDQRIDLPGPRDELTELADTFDAMLERVQRTIDEERRFAANASHELRTPLSVIRTMIEVARADPAGRDAEVVLERIGAMNERAIRSTQALLTLARAGRGVALETSALDLAPLVATAVDDMRPDAAARGIRVAAFLEPAPVRGSATLLGQLAANLLQNAVVHNVDGGWVRVRLATLPTSAELVVENSGVRLDPHVIATLTEPFVRGAGRARTAEAHDGSGLGLAIVASIVRAHGGSLTISPVDQGGLHVRVTLPR